MISATASKNINLMTKLKKVDKNYTIKINEIYTYCSESSKGDEDKDEDVDEDEDDSVIYAYQDRRKMKK